VVSVFLVGFILYLESLDADSLVVIEHPVRVTKSEVLKRHRVGPDRFEIRVLMSSVGIVGFSIELLGLLGR
jgi:hypothetical protein